MKTIVVKKEVLKELVGQLSPFKNGSNSIAFQIGRKVADEENVTCYATLVNDTMQQQVVFLGKKPADYVEGELYAKFNVKADGFISYAQAFLEYDQDVQLDFAESSTTFRVTSGNDAQISIPVVADSELEPSLPSINKNLSVLSMKAEGEKFLSFLRKGGFLAMERDDIRFADKIVFAAKKDVMEILSTNGSSVAYSILTGMETLQVNRKVVAGIALNKKAESLRGDEKTAFEEKAASAFQNGTLEKLAEEEGISLDQYNFALTRSSFDVLRTVIKAGSKVSLCMDDRHLYVRCGNTIGTYTLALADGYSFLNNIVQQWLDSSFAAKVVTDTGAFSRALNILELKDSLDHSKRPSPVTVRMGSGGMELVRGDDRSTLSVTESEGDEASVYTSIMPRPARQILSSLDKGNLLVRFFAESKQPVVFSNGDLSENVDTYVFMLPATPRAEAEETEDTEAAEGDAVEE